MPRLNARCPHIEEWSSLFLLRSTLSFLLKQDKLIYGCLQNINPEIITLYLSFSNNIFKTHDLFNKRTY